MVDRSEGKVKEMDRGCHWPLSEPGLQAIPPGAHSYPMPEEELGQERGPPAAGRAAGPALSAALLLSSPHWEGCLALLPALHL